MPIQLQHDQEVTRQFTGNILDALIPFSQLDVLVLPVSFHVRTLISINVRPSELVNQSAAAKVLEEKTEARNMERDHALLNESESVA